MQLINEVRLDVWARNACNLAGETARVDADGSIVATTGECKQGMAMSFKGILGYHPLLIPLAMRGVSFKPADTMTIFLRNVLIYGIGGVIVPFVGIKLIDLLVQFIPGVD